MKLGVVIGIVLFCSLLNAQTVITPTTSVSVSQTRDNLIENFLLVNETEMDENSTVAVFAIAGGTAEVLFIDGIAEQVDYHKKAELDAPFSPTELTYIQKVNSHGKKWHEINKVNNKTYWAVDDDSLTMFYGVYGKWKNVASVITNKGLAFWIKFFKLSPAKSEPEATPKPEVL